MSRKIKFRVWHGSENRMINIGAVHNDTALWIEERGWEAVDHLTGKPITICSNYSNKNPENVLMQFTGMKDKYGRDIYEADFVRQGDTLYEIKSCEGGFECQIWKELKGGGAIEGSTYVFSCLSDRYCEIEGNVYATPELVKVIL